MSSIPTSFHAVKALCWSAAIYQRGPNDTSGHQRDQEWRADVRRARGWAQLSEALPIGHPLRRMVDARVF